MNGNATKNTNIIPMQCFCDLSITTSLSDNTNREGIEEMSDLMVLKKVRQLLLTYDLLPLNQQNLMLLESLVQNISCRLTRIKIKKELYALPQM